MWPCNDIPRHCRVKKRAKKSNSSRCKTLKSRSKAQLKCVELENEKSNTMYVYVYVCMEAQTRKLKQSLQIIGCVCVSVLRARAARSEPAWINLKHDCKNPSSPLWESKKCDRIQNSATQKRARAHTHTHRYVALKYFNYMTHMSVYTCMCMPLWFLMMIWLSSTTIILYL